MSKLQSKKVTPIQEKQFITPDDGYSGLSKVIVEAIPDEYLIPKGTIQITSNGVAGISKFEYADINIQPLLQEKTAVLSKATQTIQPDPGCYGLQKVNIPAIPNDYVVPNGDLNIDGNGVYDVTNYKSVTVDVAPTLQRKVATPSDAQQIISADSEYDGLLSVTVDAIPSEYIIPSGNINVNTNGRVDVTKLTSVDVDVKPLLQSKQIAPTKYPQSIVADSNFDGMSMVNVDAIPEKYIIPSGTKNITANGTSNVATFDQVNVNVEPELQTKAITPSHETQIVSADSKYYGLSKVTVDPIPEGYIVPSGSSTITENGKVNVSSLATVIVDVKPKGQIKTVVPTTSMQDVRPDDDYNALTSVRVSPIPSNYIIPKGTAIITSNGDVNITQFAKATIDVQPSLQSTVIVPTEAEQTITPEAEYYGLSSVTVGAIPKNYVITSDATATASDIAFGKTAYINGKKVVGEQMVRHCYTGVDAPPSSLGVNGDIYLKIGS